MIDINNEEGVVARQQCPDCGGTGKVGWGWLKSLCTMCEGTGELSAATLNQQGATLLNQQQFAEALRKFEAASELEPRTALFWANRGMCLDGLGRVSDAMRCYHTALTFDSTLALAWLNLGIDYAEGENPSEALRCLDQAVRNDPTLINHIRSVRTRMATLVAVGVSSVKQLIWRGSKPCAGQNVAGCYNQTRGGVDLFEMIRPMRTMGERLPPEILQAVTQTPLGAVCGNCGATFCSVCSKQFTQHDAMRCQKCQSELVVFIMYQDMPK